MVTGFTGSGFHFVYCLSYTMLKRAGAPVIGPNLLIIDPTLHFYDAKVNHECIIKLQK